MIVVDTNVLAYLYLPCEFTRAAEHLLEYDSDWHAPVLWKSEFRNILAGYLRKRLLDMDTAEAIMAESESLLNNAGHEPESERVLRLVHQSDCSAYDCEFVAVAQMLGTVLFSMDAKLLKAFPLLTKKLTEAAF